MTIFGKPCNNSLILSGLNLLTWHWCHKLPSLPFSNNKSVPLAFSVASKSVSQTNRSTPEPTNLSLNIIFLLTSIKERENNLRSQEVVITLPLGQWWLNLFTKRNSRRWKQFPSVIKGSGGICTAFISTHEGKTSFAKTSVIIARSSIIIGINKEEISESPPKNRNDWVLECFTFVYCFIHFGFFKPI